MPAAQNGIFIRSHHDLKKDLRLSHAAVSLREVTVCNGEMVAAVSASALLRVSVTTTRNTTEKPTEVSFNTMPGDEIKRVHLSPTGCHCIVSTLNGDNFYFHPKSGSQIPLKKLRGVVTAIAWNPDEGSNGTKSILLGTLKGAIVETAVTATGGVVYHKEHGWAGAEKELPISSIYLHIINDDDLKASKWSLLICVPGLLYVLQAIIDVSPRPQYVVSSSLQSGWVVLPEKERDPFIFSPFFNQKDPHVVSAPNAPLLPECSSLVLYDPQDPNSHGKLMFAWLVPNGVTVGTVNLQAASAKEMITEEKTMEHRRVDGTVEAPLSISLTQFHLLLLYPNRLSALSFYTGIVVYEDTWPRELGTAGGFSFDAASHLHWLFTTKSILKYRPNDEARYVWKVFLDRGDLVRAFGVARMRKATDPDAYEAVLKKQADKYIAEANFTAAAEILAQSSEPFETIVLRLMTNEDTGRQGLKTLLDKKLAQFSLSAEDKIKRDVLFMWHLEMQLSELAMARMEMAQATPEKAAEIKERKEKLVAELGTFLKRKNLQDTITTLKDAIYRAMVDHADFESQLYIATELKDFSEMLKIYMGRELHGDALRTLSLVGSADLFYQFGPQLFPFLPSELVAAAKNCALVKAQRMIPLLVEAGRDSSINSSHIIGYTEWALSFPVSPSLHNLYFDLLARHTPMKLLEYLEAQGKSRHDVPYDLHYAMRSARQYDLKRCLIFLYCVDELWMDAVELALEGLQSVPLAKECARWMHSSSLQMSLVPPSADNDTRKGLWLAIAKHVMAGKAEASECLALLRESGDCLSIQDMLPLLPGFTRIADFKEPLVECLKDQSAKITALQRNMKDATETANEIREKTEKMKKKVMILRAGDTCFTCRQSIFNRPFFAHNCRHLFHQDCMHREIAPYLDDDEEKRLAGLLQQERRVLTELEYGDRKAVRSQEYAEREQRAAQLAWQMGEMLGRDCPVCSSRAIDMVDKTFFTPEEYEAERTSWAY